MTTEVITYGTSIRESMKASKGTTNNLGLEEIVKLDLAHLYGTCSTTPQIEATLNNHLGSIERRAIIPVCIKRRGRATIIAWKDGKVTKLVRASDEPELSLYTVFCIALGKKLFETNSALKAAVHSADEEVQLASVQKRKEEQKRQHEECMRKQLSRSTKRIARLARREFKRNVLASLLTQNIQVEEEEPSCPHN